MVFTPIVVGGTAHQPKNIDAFLTSSGEEFDMLSVFFNRHLNQELAKLSVYPKPNLTNRFNLIKNHMILLTKEYKADDLKRLGNTRRLFNNILKQFNAKLQEDFPEVKVRFANRTDVPVVHEELQTIESINKNSTVKLGFIIERDEIKPGGGEGGSGTLTIPEDDRSLGEELARAA